MCLCVNASALPLPHSDHVEDTSQTSFFRVPYHMVSWSHMDLCRTLASTKDHTCSFAPLYHFHLCTSDPILFLHRTCTCTCWLSTRASHGYCDCGTRARLLNILQHLMGLAQAISASGKSCFVCSTPSTHLAMPRYTRDYGKSSSWYAKGWAPSTFSGWSKRASRVYYSHEWDEGTEPETWADAEVEIVDERERTQGKAATTDATDRKAADAPGSSIEDAATEKESVKRRLGKLHGLLNSRKGSLNATYRKNAEANDKAYDLNHQSIQALDALAKEYVDLEVTMANVAHEQEAGDTLHVATLEVAEEPERTLKEQGRQKDDLVNSIDALTAATNNFTDCWALRLCNAFRGVRSCPLQTCWFGLQVHCACFSLFFKKTFAPGALSSATASQNCLPSKSYIFDVYLLLHPRDRLSLFIIHPQHWQNFDSPSSAIDVGLPRLFFCRHLLKLTRPPENPEQSNLKIWIRTCLIYSLQISKMLPSSTLCVITVFVISLV